MKRLITFLFVLILTHSCSKDETYNLTGNFSISGKFVTPNGMDAVTKASVKILRENDLIKESTTNSEGYFIIDNLPSGEFNIEFSKGLFMASKSINITDSIKEINLGKIKITSIPKIAVVTGKWDHIEEVLYNIGLKNPITKKPLFDIIDGLDVSNRSNEFSHRHNNSSRRTPNPQLLPNVDFGFGKFIESSNLLDNYDIIFLNCGLAESKTEFSNNLTEYVKKGGLLYSTDWAYKYLDDITDNGTQYLNFYNPYKSGQSESTEAQILNNDLSDWLSLNFNIPVVNNSVTINEFLSGWQVVDNYDENTVIPWLYGPVTYNFGINEYKYLAYTFLHGDGGVLYSSFHAENNSVEQTTVERLMQYMIFELSDLNEN